MFKRRKINRICNQFMDVSAAERESFYREFGMVMKIIRNRKDISLKEISDRLHIQETALANYEAGHEVPYFDLIAIYGYLGMTKHPINYIQ